MFCGSALNSDEKRQISEIALFIFRTSTLEWQDLEFFAKMHFKKLFRNFRITRNIIIVVEVLFVIRFTGTINSSDVRLFSPWILHLTEKKNRLLWSCFLCQLKANTEGSWPCNKPLEGPDLETVPAPQALPFHPLFRPPSTLPHSQFRMDLFLEDFPKVITDTDDLRLKLVSTNCKNLAKFNRNSAKLWCWQTQKLGL